MSRFPRRSTCRNPADFSSTAAFHAIQTNPTAIESLYCEIPQFRTLLPSHPIEVCSKSSVNYSSENFIHPILFSLGKKKHNAVRLTIPDNDSAWSEAFNVDTAGVSGQCSFSLLSAESEESIVYSYFVSISRAPGIFARSLVVSIFPLFTFVNNTTLPIKVMFVFCEMKRRFVLTLQGRRFW